MDRKRQAQNARRTTLGSRPARDPRPGRAPAADERQPTKRIPGQPRNDRDPGRIELPRRRRRSPSRNPVGLLDQRHRETHRTSGLRRGYEIPRPDPAPGSVTKHQPPDRPLDGRDGHGSHAVRCINLDASHKRKRYSGGSD